MFLKRKSGIIFKDIISSIIHMNELLKNPFDNEIILRDEIITKEGIEANLWEIEDLLPKAIPLNYTLTSSIIEYVNSLWFKPKNNADISNTFIGSVNFYGIIKGLETGYSWYFHPNLKNHPATMASIWLPMIAEGVFHPYAEQMRIYWGKLHDQGLSSSFEKFCVMACECGEIIAKSSEQPGGRREKLKPNIELLIKLLKKV